MALPSTRAEFGGGFSTQQWIVDAYLRLVRERLDQTGLYRVLIGCAILSALGGLVSFAGIRDRPSGRAVRGHV